MLPHAFRHKQINSCFEIYFGNWNSSLCFREQSNSPFIPTSTLLLKNWRLLFISHKIAVFLIFVGYPVFYPRYEKKRKSPIPFFIQFYVFAQSFIEISSKIKIKFMGRVILPLIVLILSAINKKLLYLKITISWTKIRIKSEVLNWVRMAIIFKA